MERNFIKMLFVRFSYMVSGIVLVLCYNLNLLGRYFVVQFEFWVEAVHSTLTFDITYSHNPRTLLIHSYDLF